MGARRKVRYVVLKVGILATYVVVAVMFDLWRVAGYVKPSE